MTKNNFFEFENKNFKKTNEELTKKYQEAQNENQKIKAENKNLIDQLIALKMEQARVMDELTEQATAVSVLKKKLETQVDNKKLS